MKYLIDHDVISSFKEYFEYKMLKNADAFKNKTSSLFLASGDARLGNNYTIYSSPYAQWVHTADHTGVNTAAVTVGASVVSRGTSGMRIDFKNGRAIFNSGYVPSGAVTASYSIKDFNFYIGTLPSWDFIYQRKYQQLPDLQSEAALAGDKLIAPCIILRSVETKNDPFCLGGRDRTSWNIKGLVMASSEFSLYGAFSIARDLKKTCFPLLGANDQPLNEFYDYKTGSSWSYESARDANDTVENKMYVDNVIAFPYYSEEMAQNHPGITLGMLDFDIVSYRYSRI